MSATTSFIWSKAGDRIWTLDRHPGQSGHATVLHSGDERPEPWGWVVLWPGRGKGSGMAATRDAAMMAAQRFITTKSGRRAPRKRPGADSHHAHP